MAASVEREPILSDAGNSVSTRGFPNGCEFDLLIACCAAPWAELNADRIPDILAGPLDWERMLRLVDHHRVVPQAYSALSAFSRLIPSRRLHELRLRYEGNARRALWFTSELTRVVSRLESAGVKAVPYKGPILAQTLYGEVTQRQFGDLDILIVPADVRKAAAVLLDLGYKPNLDLSRREGSAHLEDRFIETGYEYAFSSASGQNLLELQWRALPRFYSINLDVAGLLERANEINLGGRAMRTLHLEDLLLVLCVHAAKHVWVQLSWLCDIARLSQSEQLDWNAIQDNSRRMGIEKIVGLSLLLAHELLGSPLPFVFHQRLREDSSAAVLADEVLPIIEASDYYDPGSITYFRLMMRLRERWRDRARFLSRLVFTPSVSEWSAIRLPRRLQPLYRLVRLSRLAGKLASAA